MRYAFFCLKWAVALAIPLGLLLSLRPGIEASWTSIFLVSLYIGLPIGFGMAVLACIGFTIGGVFAGWLESSEDAQRLWLRVKFVLLTLIALPVTAFAIYCLWRGFAEHRILALSRSGTLISPESHPLFLGQFLRLGVAGSRDACPRLSPGESDLRLSRSVPGLQDGPLGL
ncbi:hypothetical protein ACU4HD_37165 [Cupriavidus basilensis]